MVDRLSDEFDFRIVTRDHDGPHDRTPYSTVLINKWNRVGNGDVYYLSTDRIRASGLKRLIAETAPSVIYLNSFFSPLTVRTLMLRRLDQIAGIPVVLAPEGEFSAGALAIKRVKKQLYLRLVKGLNLLHNIVWKAASESEVSDINLTLGARERILVAPNMPPISSEGSGPDASTPKKSSGRAEMVFLSRFMRKKNFNWLLEHLDGVPGELKIDIWGPIEEADYWEETQQLTRNLAPNIRIEAKGPVAHDQVPATLANYQFFILPTLGENFGHVFIEAFAAGLPVLVSDRTPWRELEERGIGWDIPLENPKRWHEVIRKCIGMDEAEYRQLSVAASSFAAEWLSDPAIIESNRQVLRTAINKP